MLIDRAQQVDWNGKDAKGKSVSSGAYIVRLQTPEAVESQKIRFDALASR